MARTSRNALRINALGRLVVLDETGPIAGAAAQPRRMAVLALLARAGERGVTRAKVLDLLWPDFDEERGRGVLSKALSALRRDFGADDVFLTTNNDLRLNPVAVTSDVAEFEAGIAQGDLERAAALYEGPFLDGFRVTGAPEFERWAETERLALSHLYMATLEQLSNACSGRGDPAGAALWWRRLAAHDPLNARHALGLMHALSASGDRAGALQHARIYEAMVEQELELPPDREVAALARRLRAEPPAQRPEPVAPLRPEALESESLPAPEPSPTRASNGRPGRAIALRRMVLIGGLAAAALLAVRLRPAKAPAAVAPVLALGHIVDHRPGATDRLARPLADMLATNLARVLDLRIVSNARMYELVGQVVPGSDTSAALLGAARRAGATELLDGALYALADGRLRLDLQRTDLATGRTLGAHSITGSDAFALADSGTARLVGDFGAAPPTGSVADVTTRSLAAYQLYEQGLRAFYQADRRTAGQLLQAALARDSSFAMAAYYGARSLREARPAESAALFRTAVRLAPRATDRERLTILGNWAVSSSSPALAALADTLITRYPLETDGHLLAGIGKVAAGRFLASRPLLERAIAMDSLGLSGHEARCSGCDALRWLTSAYQLSDSLPAAERTARRWIRLQPRTAQGWSVLAEVLGMQGKGDAALAARRQWAAFDPSVESDIGNIAALSIIVEDYARADELLGGGFAALTPERQAQADWYLAISHRYQGRLAEALADARRYRYAPVAPANPHAADDRGYMEAQVLFELGRYRESAALFGAVDRALIGRMDVPNVGRQRAWALAHRANALAAAGDTSALGALVDTLRALGAQSAFRLHQQLHHHATGLLLVARGRNADAVSAFRQALDSPNSGYTRTNLELGRALMRVGNPRAAVAVLQPALRGGIEAGNLYVTRTELHELLARAWEAAGGPGSRDSSRTHFAAAARAWARADPMFGDRLAHARLRSEAERSP